MKKTLITLATTLSAILIVTTATYAIGTLTPSGTAGDDTQYTLNDIYDRLTDFLDKPTRGGSSPFEVPGSVSASFNTLSEIYLLLEAEADDLVPENIKDGVTIFGVVGTMTTVQQTGTYQWSTDQGINTWNNASSVCNNLVESGQSDWFLPNMSILLYGMSDQYFLNYHSSFAEDNSYWSSNQFNSNDGYYATIMSLDGGISYGSTDKTNDGHVICARVVSAE